MPQPSCISPHATTHLHFRAFSCRPATVLAGLELAGWSEQFFVVVCLSRGSIDKPWPRSCGEQGPQMLHQAGEAQIFCPKLTCCGKGARMHTLSSSTVMVPLLSVSMVLKSWRRPLISSEDRQRATTRKAAFFNLVMPANCSQVEHNQHYLSGHQSGQHAVHRQQLAKQLYLYFLCSSQSVHMVELLHSSGRSKCGQCQLNIIVNSMQQAAICILLPRILHSSGNHAITTHAEAVASFTFMHWARCRCRDCACIA